MRDGPPGDGKPGGVAVHATAVAIDGRGLLILGRSGSGKSRLAFGLIAASKSHRVIRLVGDDRILLAPHPDGLVARPHPRIAGFIERRGLGIVATAYVAAAPVAALVILGPTPLPPILAQNLPATANVYEVACLSSSTSTDVLAWWRDACTTPAAKASVTRPIRAKD